MENYLEIFLVRGLGDIMRDREILGRVPAASGEYEIPGQPKISVDLSDINRRVHGPKVVVVSVQGIGTKEVALSRKLARGFQTLGTKTRLGVEAYSPVGLTR